MTRRAGAVPLSCDSTLTVLSDGTREWRRDGRLHREDGPAVEMANGVAGWYYEGQPHRSDGPAVSWPSGAYAWYVHGLLHREDGPAVVAEDGVACYCLANDSYPRPVWLRKVLSNCPLAAHQRELLDALSENWAGTPDLLYETVTHLAA